MGAVAVEYTPLRRRWMNWYLRALAFLESPAVVTSSRRFDGTGVLKTLVLTHPLMILALWKHQSIWKDWYDRPVK